MALIVIHFLSPSECVCIVVVRDVAKSILLLLLAACLLLFFCRLLSGIFFVSPNQKKEIFCTRHEFLNQHFRLLNFIDCRVAFYVRFSIFFSVLLTLVTEILYKTLINESMVFKCKYYIIGDKLRIIFIFVG